MEKEAAVVVVAGLQWLRRRLQVMRRREQRGVRTLAYGEHDTGVRGRKSAVSSGRLSERQCRGSRIRNCNAKRLGPFFIATSIFAINIDKPRIDNYR